MAKCFQCGGEHTGTYSCLPPEAPALTNEKNIADRLREMDARDTPSFAEELMREAADEIEGAHHDITSLMDACNAEVNEVERLRGELAIVTRDRDTLLEMTGHTLEQVARRIEKLRRGVHEPSGERRAYLETHEPPHCPSCDCGSEPPAD